MPRFARLWMPGSVQHLIVRFVNRSYRLVGLPERAEYLRRLGRTVAQTDWQVLAYALMSNHIHLCAVAGQDPAARLMQPLHSGFALWLNRRDRALGPVFAHRYRAVVCTPGHVARLVAYIHNNPVRARLVLHARQSSWTSHEAYLGHVVPPSWLAVEQGLAQCGFTGLQAPSRFDSWVRQQAGEPRDLTLSGEETARTRRLTRRACGGPVEVSDAIVAEAGPRHEVRCAPGTALRLRWPGAPEAALAAVAQETGVSVARIQSNERVHAVSHVRRVALLAWERLGRSRAELSVVMGLSAGAASHLVHRQPALVARAAPYVARVVERCWAISTGESNTELSMKE